MRTVIEYTQSEKFYSDVCIASLSSIPRWSFARVIEEREEKKGTSSRLGSALRAFYITMCKMVSGRDLLTEHLVNRGPSAGVLRLSLYAPLMRAYLYMAQKNRCACA